jgi:hypothetical protein
MLLRRLAGAFAGAFAPEVELKVFRPIRRSRDRLLQPGELEKDVELAAELLDGPGVILILLDSEGDCPPKLGPSLAKRACEARSDRKSMVVLAHHEYEAWFLAAAESLRGRCGLDDSLAPTPDPEGVVAGPNGGVENVIGDGGPVEAVDVI